jgi:hypothetical protein
VDIGKGADHAVALERLLGKAVANKVKVEFRRRKRESQDMPAAAFV